MAKKKGKSLKDQIEESRGKVIRGISLGAAVMAQPVNVEPVRISDGFAVSVNGLHVTGRPRQQEWEDVGELIKTAERGIQFALTFIMRVASVSFIHRSHSNGLGPMTLTRSCCGPIHVKAMHAVISTCTACPKYFEHPSCGGTVA